MPNYKYQDKLIEQRKNPETARAGLKWSPDEDNSLIDEIKDGNSIEEISKKLQRTEGSIKTRLIIKAIYYFNEHSNTINKEDVASLYGITEEDMNTYEEKKKQREQKNYTHRLSTNYNNRNYNSNAVITLSTIYNLLQEINSKL